MQKYIFGIFKKYIFIYLFKNNSAYSYVHMFLGAAPYDILQP